MSNDAFRKVLEELSAEYRGALPGKLAEIQDLWQRLAGGAEPVARVADLRRLLHTIAGSARTFGLAEVSAAAKASKTFLDFHCGSDDELGTACSLPAPPGCAAFDALLEALGRSAIAT